jgi:hypothetical protein
MSECPHGNEPSWDRLHVEHRFVFSSANRYAMLLRLYYYLPRYRRHDTPNKSSLSSFFPFLFYRKENKNKSLELKKHGNDRMRVSVTLAASERARTQPPYLKKKSLIFTSAAARGCSLQAAHPPVAVFSSGGDAPAPHP